MIDTKKLDELDGIKKLLRERVPMLIEVIRMKDAEHEGDEHNSAVKALRRLVKSWDEKTQDAKEVFVPAGELEALRKDKARLDWLADRDNSIGTVVLPSECVERNVHSMRDAIDDAMQLGDKP